MSPFVDTGTVDATSERRARVELMTTRARPVFETLDNR